MPKESFKLPVEPGTCDLYVRGDHVFKTINHDKGTKSWRRVYNLSLEIAVHDFIDCTSAGPQISFAALKAFVRTRAIVYPDALRTIGLNSTYREQQQEVQVEARRKRQEVTRLSLSRRGSRALQELQRP